MSNQSAKKYIDYAKESDRKGSLNLDPYTFGLDASLNHTPIDLDQDPVAKNIEALHSLHHQGVKDVPQHQQLLESIALFFGRPIFLYILLATLALWISDSLLDQILPVNFPPFRWSDEGLDAAALVISTGVLVRQTRQEAFAEQRAQLSLHLNLLTEQKIAKIISLLEELRTDLPNVVNRHDPEAEIMKESADPIAVLEAIQETLAQDPIAVTEEKIDQKSKPH